MKARRDQVRLGSSHFPPFQTFYDGKRRSSYSRRARSKKLLRRRLNLFERNGARTLRL